MLSEAGGQQSPRLKESKWVGKGRDALGARSPLTTRLCWGPLGRWVKVFGQRLWGFSVPREPGTQV